ncbi:DUF6624 domain-containing protein [Chryseobacterium sp. MDT2-18]|uniref:DUF6624 domain-containing protein n=1 Tax=Chryseobacterium sp. MDT2-18 TaxID=1259136 RepID=UPI002789741A|nr:DUF6624 domain-containing protein [Chryseobacterium sp. MDT2-18]MDQ0475666.1 hypothetical protein [Chryseobacterium sp. MDT2-18]
MKNLTFLLLLIFIGCNSIQKISTSEREKIISELEYIMHIDQKYAGIPSEELDNRFGREKAWKIFESKRDSVGIDNQNRIKILFNKFGYLGFKEVGKENANNFWITIQHADNDVEFQKKMLKALRNEIKKNNASRSNYAMLEDRISVNTNKKQRFGSQVTYNEFGQAIPKNGLIDSVNIEKLRNGYGLENFKVYYNRMTINHFRMNKEYLQKQGISEPKLYE